MVVMIDFFFFQVKTFFQQLKNKGTYQRIGTTPFLFTKLAKTKIDKNYENQQFPFS